MKYLLGFEGEFFHLQLILDSEEIEDPEEDVWVCLKDHDEIVTFVDESPTDALDSIRSMIEELNELYGILERKIKELTKK